MKCYKCSKKDYKRINRTAFDVWDSAWKLVAFILIAFITAYALVGG